MGWKSWDEVGEKSKFPLSLDVIERKDEMKIWVVDSFLHVVVYVREEASFPPPEECMSLYFFLPLNIFFLCR